MSITAYRKTMTEQQMRCAIIETVERTGGRVFYVHDSRSAPAMADFPDLVLLLPNQRMTVFVELKSWRRAITDGQRAVLDLLGECPRADAFVVRSEPRDETEIGFERFMAWLGGN